MRDDQASQTALLIAAATVWLRRSPCTSHLVSATTAELGEKLLRQYSRGSRLLLQPWSAPLARWIERRILPGIFLHYALRKKYLANLARAAGQRSVQQFVILGAGFDGCALELSRENPPARFWEIDHPATQSWKARELGKSARVQLLPADLGAGQLPLAALTASGFDSGAPSFWIAEGLLMYFPEKTIRTLLAAIAALAPTGSRFAFTFMEKTADGRIRFQSQTKLIDWWLRRRSEPFLWAAARAEIKELLASWSAVAFFDDHDLRALGELSPATALAVGEIICLATR